MTAERRLCSACLMAGRETPARHADAEQRVIDGKALLWCDAHCSFEEFVAVTGDVPLQQVRERLWADLGEGAVMTDDDAPAEPGARGGVAP